MKINTKILNKLGMTEDEVLLAVAQKKGYKEGDVKDFLDDLFMKTIINPAIVEIVSEKKDVEKAELTRFILEGK
jgi:hypothetical protein